jgi:hypothetical protein
MGVLERGENGVGAMDELERSVGLTQIARGYKAFVI